MHEEESIYSLIPPEEQPKIKPERHVSKYPYNGATTGSCFAALNIGGAYETRTQSRSLTKKTAPNYGPKGTSTRPDPASFLKKTQREIPEPQPYHYTMRNKEPLPRGDGKLRHTQTNFVEDNALKAITGHYQRPQKAQPIDFTKKPEYGKVPSYLHEVKSDIQKEREYVAAIMQREQQQLENSQPKMKLLPENERLRLLDSLKEKWGSVNHEYQKHTQRVRLDTVGSVRRKEDFEAQLTSLEKSIEKLSKQYVFVQEGESWWGGWPLQWLRPRGHVIAHMYQTE